ncbi:MAG: dihydropteroate synthase [Chloroflexota bacterium]|nr:dihydropteroate synthase [Chloroflexota bacterium]
MNRYNVRFLRCSSEKVLRQEMRALGADPQGVQIMLPKARFSLIKVEGLGLAAATILKQEMLAKGGDAAISGSIYLGQEHSTDALLMGTQRTLDRVVDVLYKQPLPSLQQLGKELAAALAATGGQKTGSCRIGTREFAWGDRTFVMGILNATPDSFSGDGLLTKEKELTSDAMEQAVDQALAFVRDGADIIDIGGESTRPGSQPVDARVELHRVLPIIRELRKATQTPISIDTYKATVAEEALDAGADMVNDVWGLRMDPDMAPLVAACDVPVVLMHNRSKPKNAEQQQRLGGRYVDITYKDLMGDILRELREQIDFALEAGIAPDKIIIDPGIGFGKTVEQNLRLLNHVDELRVLEFPLLIGPSRKSFIGYTLDLPPEERVEGTAAAVALAITRGGADIIRVHDVQAMARVARMADAIVRGE